ncbi:MAG: HAMP domain-containing sensor histidine kinase [bacterium]
MEEIPYSAEVITLLQDNVFFSNILKVDDQYLMFQKVNNTIRVCNITGLMEAQQKMIIMFLVLLIFFSVGTYFLSLIFVRTSLKDIHLLVDYVKKLNINTLHEPVPLSGPEDDEIRIIGQSLQQTLSTIKEQTDSLKDFVTHASHELKTPLMSLSAVIDAGEKTGNHEKAFIEAKTSLKSINTLFETLLSITKWEYQKIKTAPLDIVPVMKHLLDEVQKNYKKKLISCEVQLPKTCVLETNEDMFHIIFFNLLENAYKYTPHEGNIKITLSCTTLSISNS